MIWFCPWIIDSSGRSLPRTVPACWNDERATAADVATQPRPSNVSNARLL